MNSPQLGHSTSAVEVLGVSPRGLWLLVLGREYFLDHQNFPWFASASVAAVYDVALEHGHIVRWPQIDVDLELESLAEPERWPLIARVGGEGARGRA